MWNISFLPQTKLVDTGAWYRDKFRNFLYKNHISSGRFVFWFKLIKCKWALFDLLMSYPNVHFGQIEKDKKYNHKQLIGRWGHWVIPMNNQWISMIWILFPLLKIFQSKRFNILALSRWRFWLGISNRGLKSSTTLRILYFWAWFPFSKLLACQLLELRVVQILNFRHKNSDFRVK